MMIKDFDDVVFVLIDKELLLDDLLLQLGYFLL